MLKLQRETLKRLDFFETGQVGGAGESLTTSLMDKLRSLTTSLTDQRSLTTSLKNK